jgi:hypothetical protein
MSRDAERYRQLEQFGERRTAEVRFNELAR